MNDHTVDPTQQRLQRLSMGMIIAFTLTIAAAWFFLPENYTFFLDYISYLGGIRSKHEQLPNLVSQIIFAAGLGFCAVLMLIMAGVYVKSRKHAARDLSKAFFLVVAAIGAIMTAIPHDIPNYAAAHYMGAFAFVVALNCFLIECYFLARKKDRTFGAILEKICTILLVIITAVYVFLYLYFKFLPESVLFGVLTPSELPIFQKIMVIMIIVSFLLIDKADLAPD